MASLSIKHRPNIGGTSPERKPGRKPMAMMGISVTFSSATSGLAGWDINFGLTAIVTVTDRNMGTKCPDTDRMETK